MQRSLDLEHFKSPRPCDACTTRTSPCMCADFTSSQGPGGGQTRATSGLALHSCCSSAPSIPAKTWKWQTWGATGSRVQLPISGPTGRRVCRASERRPHIFTTVGPQPWLTQSTQSGGGWENLSPQLRKGLLSSLIWSRCKICPIPRLTLESGQIVADSSVPRVLSQGWLSVYN